MSLHDQDDPALRAAQEERLRAVWKPPQGLFLRWTDTNNNRVGVWYVLTAFGFMLFAGVLALIMRTQLAVPDNELVSANSFNQLFTLHGSMMMFLFAVPMFEAVSIILLPQLLGARDLPFPRLSAFGYWSFLIGGVFVSGSIFFNAAPDGGWFMYPPLTTRTDLSGLGADIWMLGLSFIEVSSVAAAVELIVGVLKCRPPGMRLNLMPLYAWYILVVAVMILFAFPPLIAGDILFEMERLLDWPFFDANRGGDPLLWQHLFWIFGHPEVYIIFLPSIALFGLMIPIFARFGHALGYVPAVTAVFLYSLLPIMRNTYLALENIEAGIKEAGIGIGMTFWQRLRMVDLPLAVPVILGGVRTAVVMNIGVMAIAAVIGDLIASVLKRLANVKDSGGVIPGIGGMLDLTDSLMLAAPTGYFLYLALLP